MKPCLVHKASTSDEELQSHDINQTVSTQNGPTHGILKVPSGSTSPELHVPYHPPKHWKTKNKSKSVSPLPPNDNSSVIIGAPPHQHHRVRHRTSEGNKKTSEQTIVSTTTTNMDRVTLVVDETRFVIDPQLFRAHSNTMLGRMFSISWETSLVANERGEYEIANGISATIFRALLVRKSLLFSNGSRRKIPSRIFIIWERYVVHHRLAFKIYVKLAIISSFHLINRPFNVKIYVDYYMNYLMMVQKNNLNCF